MKTKFVVTSLIAVLILSGNGYAGDVSGTAKFTGTAPTREPLSMAADPTCAAIHTEPVLAENVLVNANGTLKNAFVYVKQGLEGKTFPAPATPAVIDQNGCRYTPHVFGVQVGQDLQILNSDNTLHNIHSMAAKNKQFNLGMPIQGMKLNKKFENPEIMVKMKCDVHPWMSAYIGVLPHPFFSVSGDDGSFSIKDLPAGDYVVEAWHEQYGAKEQKVTVTEGAPATLEFDFGA
jgi:plastocyanin